MCYILLRHNWALLSHNSFKTGNDWLKIQRIGMDQRASVCQVDAKNSVRLPTACQKLEFFMHDSNTLLLESRTFQLVFLII